MLTNALDGIIFLPQHLPAEHHTSQMVRGQYWSIIDNRDIFT